MDRSYVLIKPLRTEKTTGEKNGMHLQDRVAFKVHPEANKVEIKEAVETIFNVTVEAVNVVRVRPSDRKRQGRVVGRKPGYKKAYVKLAPGDIKKLDFLEGV